MIALNATANDSTCYPTDVLVLCVECQQLIKARINTNQWIRVEWIGPGGECLKCYQQAREAARGNADNRTNSR
jgi:hypothetical protein